MKSKKIVEVSADEILDLILDMVGSSEELTPKSSNVHWEVRETGDHDRGNYRVYLEKIIIEIEG